MWQVKEYLYKRIGKITIKPLAYNTASLHGNKPIFCGNELINAKFLLTSNWLENCLTKFKRHFMNRRRDEEKRNEPTITKHTSLIWLPANSPIIYSCDLGGEWIKLLRVTEGFHSNDTKSLLMSSAKQFRHEVQLGFDCLLYFILSFLALENILHIIYKIVNLL